MSTRTTTVRESGTETSARFEARARAARWRSRRPVLVAVLVAMVLVAVAALAYFGPVLVVRSVQVRGLDGPAADQVVRAVGDLTGTPLAQVDTGAVGDRVRRVPAVASVEVRRGWPSTLQLVVRPRVAVAAVPATGVGYRLVDASGVAFAKVARAPAGVPVIDVPVGVKAADTLGAALTVLDALPPALRSRVSRVSADSPDDVRMRLGAATVVWGSGDDSELKARVLTALTKHKAKVYDVSSPSTPVLR
ncbi:cell division protein FtsQ/DivIB [Angustibacter sp. McL0619]|uniref:cell division protein FtsQ/DivIB n=1 Tax=Angustibacter sp. McL0619 TaxID=3415676 RepID=UPI003CF10B4E